MKPYQLAAAFEVAVSFPGVEIFDPTSAAQRRTSEAAPGIPYICGPVKLVPLTAEAKKLVWVPVTLLSSP